MTCRNCLNYQSMGDLDKAEEHYDIALSQAIYGNDPAGQARVYGNIGSIFILRKMFEKAIPHCTIKYYPQTKFRGILKGSSVFVFIWHGMTY